MPHIAHSSDNGLQPDRGEHDRFERVLDTALGERSAAEQCAYTTQRLAALGGMTGGILNLVVNAREAMPHGGEIRISTERWVAETAISDSPAPGAYVRVCVNDAGQGIPAEVVERSAADLSVLKGLTRQHRRCDQVDANLKTFGENT